LFGLASQGLSASGTDKIAFKLNPAEMIDGLMATGRAGDFDLSVFDHQLKLRGCVEHNHEETWKCKWQAPASGPWRASAVTTAMSAFGRDNM
jgi:hypothetical protein